MEKPKVLILYNKLFHYRIPIWNLLAEKCDLTVTYSDGKADESECNFKVRYLPARSYHGRFFIQKENIRRMAKQYDVIIAYGDISWLKFSTLPWFNSQKVIFWSLGVSASYVKGFDAESKWDKIRAFFYNKADALVFYTEYPIKKYSQMGIDVNKMFEAPNTVKVVPVEGKHQNLLFIGTLYREKGLQLLLDAYKNVQQKHGLPTLDIVGNGPDYDVIKEWVKENDLEEKVLLHGAIYDVNKKAEYFANAIACISPLQAGLSVLESMGNGVPFVTIKDAITGGEIFNIHDGVDGVLMNSSHEMESVLEDITKNRQKYSEMGKRAKQFYNTCRTPQHMADGLWNAIKYVLE